MVTVTVPGPRWGPNLRDTVRPTNWFIVQLDNRCRQRASIRRMLSARPVPAESAALAKSVSSAFITKRDPGKEPLHVTVTANCGFAPPDCKAFLQPQSHAPKWAPSVSSPRRPQQKVRDIRRTGAQHDSLQYSRAMLKPSFGNLRRVRRRSHHLRKAIDENTPNSNDGPTRDVVLRPAHHCSQPRLDRRLFPIGRADPLGKRMDYGGPVFAMDSGHIPKDAVFDDPLLNRADARVVTQISQTDHRRNVLPGRPQSGTKQNKPLQIVLKHDTRAGTTKLETFFTDHRATSDKRMEDARIVLSANPTKLCIGARGNGSWAKSRRFMPEKHGQETELVLTPLDHRSPKGAVRFTTHHDPAVKPRQLELALNPHSSQPPTMSPTTAYPASNHPSFMRAALETAVQIPRSSVAKGATTWNPSTTQSLQRDGHDVGFNFGPRLPHTSTLAQRAALFTSGRKQGLSQDMDKSMFEAPPQWDPLHVRVSPFGYDTQQIPPMDPDERQYDPHHDILLRSAPRVVFDRAERWPTLKPFDNGDYLQVLYPSDTTLAPRHPAACFPASSRFQPYSSVVASSASLIRHRRQQSR